LIIDYFFHAEIISIHFIHFIIFIDYFRHAAISFSLRFFIILPDYSFIFTPFISISAVPRHA